MKILQICKKTPYPPRDGETKAIHALSSGLIHEGCDLTVLSFNTSKHFVGLEERSSAPYPLITVDLDNSLNYFNVFYDYLKGLSPNLERFYSNEMVDAIERIAANEDFDLIQLEGSYLVAYIPLLKKLFNVPVVVRTHNVEYFIWQRLSESSVGLKKAIYSRLSQRMKRNEIQGLEKANALVTISSEDNRIFAKEGLNLPSLTIPMGVNGKCENIEREAKPFTVAFLGSMDWMPNIEGVGWFLEHVWPLIYNERPESRCFIAGRNMCANLKSKSIQGVEIVGEVTCPIEYLKDKQISIIPLLSGSGMRIKAIESMALSVPVVSTSVGVEGIPYVPNEHLIIGDSPRDFADGVLKIFDKPNLGEKMASQARILIKEEFDNHILSARLKSFYESLRDS